MYRAGRTDAGARTAASHTGVLTQNASVVDEVLASVGVIMHYSFDDLFETTYAAVQCGHISHNGGAIYSASGGANVQAADLAIQHGLELAQLTPETVDFLRSAYPLATAGNPYNPTGLWLNQPDCLAHCVAAMADDLAVAAPVQLLPAQHAPYGWAHVDIADKARMATDTPVVTVSMSAGPLTRLIEDGLRSRGIPVFESIGGCFGALARLAGASAAHRRQRSVAPAVDLPGDRDTAFRAALDGSAPGAPDEVTSKRLMRAYGIPVVEEIVAGSADAARRAAERLSYPVVMKTLVSGLTHKTEAGSVRLNLGTAAAVEAAYPELADPAHGTVVLQPMITGGVELIVGARRDEQLGPIVIVGIGGILTELIGDTSCRLALVQPADTAAMVDSLRSSRLLDGFRGAPRVPRKPIEDILVRLSWLLVEQLNVSEVDLNPLIAAAAGPVAVDAAVITRTRPTRGAGDIDAQP